jgi:hypothetical protein
MSTKIAPEHKEKLQVAADKTAAASPSTPNAFLTFAFNVVLPLLPMLLTSFTPKILKNKRLVAVLRESDKVIDGILEQAGE